MDEPNDFSKKTNQLLHNVHTSSVPGKVARIPSPPVQAPPVIPSPINFSVANNVLPRNYRRVSMPMQYMPSTVGASYGNGTYNNYPYRPYMNMNMGGYNPYTSYGQSMNNQHQNPVVIAAAENCRPAFDSIQSVVQSFNAVSMMLESTFTAMHMSFDALLGVAENFTRLRMFMMKLSSTIVSFKLIRWFLTKLFYLLRMVRGDKGSSAEEDLWTNLSSIDHEVIPSAGRSWPVVVFTGLLFATPYFVYKLLNSVTPVSNPTTINDKNIATTGRFVFKSPIDWNSSIPNTMNLVKGQSYWSTNSRLRMSTNNGGWLLVDDANGQNGYIPVELLKMIIKTNNAPPQPIPTTSETVLPIVPEQTES